MSGVQRQGIWRPIVLAFFLSLITIISQPMGTIDRIWSDIMLTSEKLPVSQDFMIVEITTHDTVEFGGPGVPRNVLATTLRKLQDAGAQRVLFDLTLREEFTSLGDRPLIAAMSSFGPDKVGIPQGSAEKFSTSATQIDLALLTDPDGWTRTVRTSKAFSGVNPSSWLATGELLKEKISVDLRYDISTIKRLSLSEFLENGAGDLTNYSVIVSPDTDVSRSRTQLPLSARPDRAGMIVLGSESIAAGYQNKTRVSWWANVAIAFLFTIFGALLAAVIHSTTKLISVGVLMSFAAVGINLAMIRVLGGQGYPVLQFSCLLIGAIVTISYRLRLFHVMAGLLKGNLSPEEAWAWRAHEDSQFPVILLNAMGHIRLMNSTAEQMKDCLVEDFSEAFQSQFTPGAAAVSFTDCNGLVRKFALEVPNSAVAIIVMKDITEAERKLAALNADRQHLEQTTDALRKSQTQAIELAETYEQKKNHAEAISAQKSRFLANMSHELRTPLNAINGFSDIMQREVFGPMGDPRYKEFANNIQMSGQHLLSLINDILDLSKIEAGKMQLNPELVDINNLVSHALQIINVRAQQKRLKLIYDSKNLPQIMADPRAVKQVLLNLLTNAIKFTPEDGVVKVGIDLHTSGLLIHVADSGIGISPEDIERLAKPFEQVDHHDSKNMEGTGLGLSLSKSLVELHGGIFKIESMVGQGTCVSFSLPSGHLMDNPVATGAHQLEPASAAQPIDFQAAG